MNDFTMTIGGQAVAAQSTFPVLNPATGSPFADAPACSPDQLDSAVEAAQGALPNWHEDEQARRNGLRAASAAIQSSAEALATTLTREQGKPFAQAKEEVRRAADFLGLAAARPLPFDVLKDDEKERIEVRWKAFGVVAAILPWNFPLQLAAWKIGQALLAGNTLVLKPSPYTPLATLQMGALLRDKLPGGVLNVISGSNEIGGAMTVHPGIRKISFTGSVSTGKKIAQAAAADLKHVTLELGGNDPAIVLADVDPARIAEKLFWSAFHNCGQTCIAIKRVYAHETIYSRLVDAMAELARQAKVGDGFEAGTQIGPLNNKMQFERVISLVQDAKRSGGARCRGRQVTARPRRFLRADHRDGNKRRRPLGGRGTVRSCAAHPAIRRPCRCGQAGERDSLWTWRLDLDNRPCSWDGACGQPRMRHGMGQPACRA